MDNGGNYTDPHYRDNYYYMHKILNNKYILNMDDKYFDKTLQIIYENILQARYLSEALDINNLSKKRVETIIDYYLEINTYVINKKLRCYWDKDIPLYSITSKDRFLKLNDEDYRKTLERICMAPLPDYEAKLFANNLNPKQIEVAINLINKSDEYIKYELSCAATAPLLIKQPISEY